MLGHQIRPLFVKWGGGVDSVDTQGFIGGNVGLDTVHPEKIHIGKGAVITEGVIILTHYTNQKQGNGRLLMFILVIMFSLVHVLLLQNRSP